MAGQAAEGSAADGPAGDAHLLELYRLYLATAERVSDRRAAANTWLLSVNAAIVGFNGFLAQGEDDGLRWGLAIPVAGLIVCLAWAGLIASYRKLNAAKFTVLQEMEARLGLEPFTREEAVYRTLGRQPLTRLELAMPVAFALLFAALIGAALATER